MNSSRKSDELEEPLDCRYPSLELARTILAHNADPIMLADAETAQFVYANLAAEQMLGKSCVEICQMRVPDMHLEEDREFAAQQFSQAIKSELRLVSEAPIADTTGKVTYYDIHVQAIDIGGRPHVLGTFRDVTDRRNAQLAVREGEDRFKVAIDGLPMGLHLYDLQTDGRLVFAGANQAADRILGVENSRFIGKTIEDAFPPLTKTDIPSTYRRLAKEGGFWRDEQVAYEDDNITGAFEVVAFQVKPGETGALFWDITERRKAEEGRRRLMAAISATAESVMITDSHGIIQYVNPFFESTTGYTLDDVKGKHIRSIKSGQHDKEFYERMWEVLGKGETWSGFIINRRKDGSLYHEQATISPVKNSEHKVVNYVAVKRDITHELDLERRVMHSQKMAALGQFAHRVAHDVTNALSTILGSAEVMGHTAKDDTNKDLIEAITSSVDRVTGLTASLMAFANPGNMNVKRQRIDRCIEGMEELIARACHPDVAVSYEMEEKLCSEIDVGQFEQAIMHLVVNATEAIEEHGSLAIEVSRGLMPVQIATENLAFKPAEGPAVIIRLTDTGKGLSPEECARAFEPFYTTKRDQRRNAGLGLATVYSIISAFNGDVSISSTEGGGATVRIALPMVD